MNITELTALRLKKLDEADALAATDEGATEAGGAKIDALIAEAKALAGQIDRLNALAEQRQAFPEASVVATGLPTTATTGDVTNTALVAPIGTQSPAITIPASAKRWGGNTLKAFKGPDADLRAYRAGQFLRAALFQNQDAIKFCATNGIPIEAATMTTGNNASAGFVVFDEFRTTIIDLVETFGVFRANAESVPMGSDVMLTPKILSGLTAFFVGEDEAPTESEITGGNVKLVAKILAVISKMSESLSSDAVINLADKLAEKIALAMALKEDQCGFNGDGTSTFGGITGATVAINDGTHTQSVIDASSGKLQFSDFTIPDFETMVGRLPQFGYAQGERRWYISNAGFYASMSPLMTAQGGNTIDIIAGGTRPQFLGFPVVVSQVLNEALGDEASTIKVLFGSMPKAASFGDRALMSIRTDNSGKFFENGVIAIKGMERFDINVHTLGDNTDAGPLIALKTAAS